MIVHNVNMAGSATRLRILTRIKLCGLPTLPGHGRSNKLGYIRVYSRQQATNTTSTAQYCLHLVKQYDYENFLSVLLLPQTARTTALAIRAFNVELSQVSDVTSETLMAKMRLQFWRETLSQIYKSTAPRQPVAMELQRAVKQHGLSKRWLQNLIDSRENQLNNKQFASLAAVEDYCEMSNSSLYYLILQGLGIKNVHADHAASHLGKAEGILKLVRGVPHYGAKRKVFLPREIMLKYGVSDEDVIRGSKEQKVRDVIYDTASLAHHHLDQARGLIRSVPKDAEGFCLHPCCCCGSLSQGFTAHSFSCFDSVLNKA
nr:NADH dehydrogenase (ubiquinone) complex I, assembly factor 6-like [Cherax quadricarinatus]